jgi:hypothetical protein
MIDKISKLLWYLKGNDIPRRRGRTYLNFCIHSEVIYDDGTYESILRFSKDFNKLTGSRIVMCVSTPLCPLVEKSLNERGLSHEMFEKRVVRLSDFAEIGYHGHFYPRGTTTFDHMRNATYDKDLVIEQIDGEMGWFDNAGIIPKVYVGGCWFMMKEIVIKLEQVGIMVDVSVRKGRSDTFGGVYVDPAVVPDHGIPFILPPAKNIVEIPSIFGPVMPNPVMLYHLSKYMPKDVEGDLSFVFPLHDWDMPRYYKNIWSNVEAIGNKASGMGWMDVMEMRERYLSGVYAKNSGNIR